MNDQEALDIVLMIVKEWLDDAASSSGAPGQSEPEERIGQPWVAIEEAIERVMDFMPSDGFHATSHAECQESGEHQEHSSVL